MEKSEKDKELYNKDPEEYYKRLYQARYGLLSKGFKMKDVEGTSLSECEDKLKRMFIIKLPYNSKWTIVSDPTMASDLFRVNGKSFQITEEMMLGEGSYG